MPDRKFTVTRTCERDSSKRSMCVCVLVFLINCRGFELFPRLVYDSRMIELTPNKQRIRAKDCRVNLRINASKNKVISARVVCVFVCDTFPCSDY